MPLGLGCDMFTSAFRRSSDCTVTTTCNMYHLNTTQRHRDAQLTKPIAKTRENSHLISAKEVWQSHVPIVRGRRAKTRQGCETHSKPTAAAQRPYFILHAASVQGTRHATESAEDVSGIVKCFATLDWATSGKACGTTH